MRRMARDYRLAEVWEGCDYILMDPPWNYRDRPPSAASQVSFKYSIWGDGSLNSNGSEFARCLRSCSASVKAVFCWCPWSIMEEAIAGYSRSFNSNEYELGKFTLRNVITWIKLKSKGGVKLGLGNSTKNATEGLMIYVRANAKPPRLQIPNVFMEYSGIRTRKPKQFERNLVESLDGYWRYVFSGPDYMPFKGLDIDLVDTCFKVTA